MKKQCIGTIAAMLATCVVLVPFARATPYVLWETFSDADGNPAFHPLFNHTFERKPEHGTGSPLWDFLEWPATNHLLFVDETTIDYITFNLGPGEYVSHVSLLYSTDGPGSVSFIGQQGTQDFELDVSYIDPVWTLLEMDMTTIGPIDGIVLSGGAFDDIMITVVPEPSTWLLFITGAAALVVRRKHRRKPALA